MEAVDVEAFPEGEWDCFYRIFSIEEDVNTEIESMFSPTVFMANDPEYFVLPNDNDFNFDMMMMMNNEDDETGDPSQNSDQGRPEPKQLLLKRNPELSLPDKKKKARVSNDRKNNGVGNKKKNKVEESNNAESDGLGTTYNYASEDDNDTSNNTNNDEKNSGGATSSASKSNGKRRATRGSATDPQSLYARRRRERINERLRTLQSLVPNGTKVDISTMLEEAVHYVKFLQLQIKLLSSDDMWMYAPIAYNAFDIGLNLSPQQH